MDLLSRVRSQAGSIFRLFIDPKAFIVGIRSEKKILSIISNNVELKNTQHQKNNRCFIIGNGSSLAQMDLAKLKNEDVFIVNNFIVHKDLIKIKPKYYVNIEPIDNLQKYDKNSDYYLPRYYKNINCKLKNLDTILFFRYSSKRYIEINKLFCKNKKYFINSSRSIFDAEKYGYIDDISKTSSFGETVISASVNIAAYIGYKKIYLIGCDEDYYCRSGYSHFYRDKVIRIKDKSNETMAYEHFLDLKRWRLLANYFSKRNVKIYNAGIGGFLDVFPRVNFDSLLK